MFDVLTLGSGKQRMMRAKEIIMNTFNENVDGYDCRFEIYPNPEHTQFKGKAVINDSCISTDEFNAEDIYPTENSVKEYLRGEIKEYLRNPSFRHPMVNYRPQSSGSTCVSCNRILSGNNGWHGIT